MELNLRKKYFDLIKNGEKTIELRLFDEKRKNIKIGDILIFKNDGDEEILQAKVINLYNSDCFENLVKLFDIKKTGFSSIKELNECILEFYTKEKQEKYGVLGIEIKIL
ncbi:MAG: ASCH domain-containing protein [Rickettsiales bacterium]|nr:ASCH domain-containing protein [Rickettsiales bacterium]